MWHIETCFSECDGDGMSVGLGDINGLFQLYDFMIKEKTCLKSTSFDFKFRYRGGGKLYGVYVWHEGIPSLHSFTA